MISPALSPSFPAAPSFPLAVFFTGKSSLLNALVGEERSIVSDVAGTTRDAIDTDITLPDGKKITLIDTAGVRKRARVADSKDGAESISVERSIRAVRRADVVVLVIDGTEGVTQQDFRYMSSTPMLCCTAAPPHAGSECGLFSVPMMVCSPVTPLYISPPDPHLCMRHLHLSPAPAPCLQAERAVGGGG